MPVIKTFIRSLAQAFGISSPQQVNAPQVSCTWAPPTRPRPESDPNNPQTAYDTTKKE
jgi:hypothetical protein